MYNLTANAKTAVTLVKIREDFAMQAVKKAVKGKRIHGKGRK